MGGDRSPTCDTTNFTEYSCKGLSIDSFASAIMRIYRVWADESTWGNSRPDVDVDVHQLNGHFKPQVGHQSCFQDVRPEAYDQVSTISNTAAMRKFSEHLSLHNHGLWAGKSSNAHGNLYFEGKPWRVPSAVIAKLAHATRAERAILQRYL